jgi:hypothetical protein
MHTDTWAVSPAAANSTYFRAAAAQGSGAVSLLFNDFAAAGAVNGCGYNLTINSTGNDSGTTYTIVGTIVGQTRGTTTSTQLGGNAGTPTTGTSYWATITSISASGAATGNVSIGFSGNLALPRTRIRGVHYVGAATAGSIVVRINNASTGTVALNIDTPATATWAGYVNCGGGLIIGRSAAQSDFGIVILTQVSKCTFFCS